MNQPTFVDPDTWYAQLPTLYGAAGALITDAEGRVLLVKPNYREHWAIPGGTLDAGESPHKGCAREIREELGLTLLVGRLLVMDWAPPLGKRPRPIAYFMFDCGQIDDPARINLQTDELDDYAFVEATEASSRLAPNVASRLPAALRARETASTIYLPGGMLAMDENNGE